MCPCLVLNFPTARFAPWRRARRAGNRQGHHPLSAACDRAPGITQETQAGDAPVGTDAIPTVRRLANQKRRPQEDQPMTDSIAAEQQVRQDAIRVNRVTMDHPWEWLDKGWHDMIRARKYSLPYGAVVVLISGLITLGFINEGLTFMVPFMIAGFYLLAPIIGLGLYQMSAHLERGEPLRFCSFLEAWKGNQAQLGVITAGLLIIMQLWMMSNFVLFALLYTGMHPPLENFFSTVFLSGKNNVFALASVGVGSMLAFIAYAISAISVPMILDRDVDGFTAIRTSVKAVFENWKPMLLWAGLIVAFIGLGLLSFFIGLFIAMPLIGHATWHAYRDIVPAAE
jgi:uncharacterized membrane protein